MSDLPAGVEAALDEVVAQRIITASAEAFGWRPGDLTGPSRRPSIVHARHIAMYLIRARTPLSLPDIGRLFGDRHHTTVLHAVTKVADLWIAENVGMRNAIARVDRELGP